MKHHYWEAPIVIYLFLGGLGGGIMCLTAIMSLIVNPGTGSLFFVPMFFALAALAIGCFFLVFELGQPLVFWRVWTTATAIIKWGATLLVIAMFGDIFWLLGYLDVLPLDWGFLGAIASVFGGGTPVFATIAGIAGFGIMVYTGVMLSTLKAHSFWATPALPVLFTISALSTACAAIALSLGIFAEPTVALLAATEEIHEIIHVVDIILVCAEVTVLLIMILSFLGAGNVTQKAVARRWVVGKTAPLFWLGMIVCGLVLPVRLRRRLRGIHRGGSRPRALRRPAAPLPLRVLRRARRDSGREPLLQSHGRPPCGVRRALDLRREHVLSSRLCPRSYNLGT